MGFVNPIFIFGLAGAGLPVAIHLLTRDRIRKVILCSIIPNFGGF